MTEGRREAKTAGKQAIADTVAERLRRLIAHKNHSFERLAELSGIDPNELLRIRSGSVTPTIDHLWRIANALGIPFGSLVTSKGRRDTRVVRNSERQSVTSHDGNFITRPLFPYDSSRSVEFYEIEIAPGHRHRVEAHAPRTKENLVVLNGSLEVTIGHEAPQTLSAGDAIDFLADVPHSYRNLHSEPVVAYLVISYETGAGDDF
jgi:quercetin dioxygenase-like cupin family protein/DNA-binding Xre family transcriptional regulator